MNPKWRSLLFRYGSAVASVVIGLSLRGLLTPYVGSGFRYVVCFPIVAVGALCGGMGPAILATLLSSLGCLYLFKSPPNAPSDMLSLVVVWFACLTIGASAEVQHRTQRRLENALEESARQQERVEREERQRRQAEDAAHQADRHRIAILESITDAFMALDKEWRFIYVNERAAQLLRRPRQALIGKVMWEEFPQTVDLSYLAACQEAMETQTPAHVEHYYPTLSLWTENDLYPSQEGLTIYSRDITRRKEDETRRRLATEQIEALNERLRGAMKETHHRVKNNLQLISSLVDMQVSEGKPSVSIEELKRLRTHINTLSKIHDLLTISARDGGETESLSTRAALLKLIDLVRETIGGRSLTYHFDDVSLATRQITSLTVIANEMLSNAFKHSRGDVEIRLEVEGDQVCLEVNDSGAGFPPDFDPVKEANTGIELIESLSRWDLRGETTYSNRPGGGAQVTVVFPVRP